MVTESEAYDALNSDYQFPPLEVRAFGRDAQIRDRRADWLLEISWKDSTAQFAVEYRALATPRRLRAAMAQTRRRRPGDPNPMVVAPYLSPKALDMLLDAEISGLDLSGNGVLVIPGQWLIYRSGRKNQFPSSVPIRAIYDRSSSLVGRVFLVKRMFPRVRDIQEEISRLGGKISLGTVSKVLNGLEEDLMVARNGMIQLIQPESLLDKLAANYRIPISRKRLGRINPDDLVNVSAWAARTRNRFAVSGESWYTSFPGSERLFRIYATSLERLFAQMAFEEDSRFPNAEIVETADQRVFFDTRERDGIRLTSPIQTYLELSAGGKRERETAQQLRPMIVDDPGQ